MPMTVRELIADLQTLDPDHMVVLSQDAEGNGYSPLTGFSEGRYEALSTWSGDVYSEEDLKDGYGDESLPSVVVLWPTN